VLDVVVDRLGREEQCLGYLLRGETASRQAQHLDLAIAEPARVLRPWHSSRLVTRGREHRLGRVVHECPVDDVAAQLGGVDLLVNCAGILREGYFELQAPDVLREVMEVNYFGAVAAIRAVLPHLKVSPNGHILNIASVAALTGAFGYTAYCGSKHAVLGVSEALRAELAPQGIRVQVVCPSEFDSPMVDGIDTKRTPENRAHALTIPKVGVDVIVRGVMRGLDSRRFLMVPGVRTRLMVFALRHFPGISRWIGDRRVRAVYQGPPPVA
jgi:3-dehydrosphinganine reductase